jgi:hypothetical protein
MLILAVTWGASLTLPGGLTADGGVNLRYPPSVLRLQ